MRAAGRRRGEAASPSPATPKRRSASAPGEYSRIASLIATNADAHNTRVSRMAADSLLGFSRGARAAGQGGPMGDPGAYGEPVSGPGGALHDRRTARAGS